MYLTGGRAHLPRASLALQTDLNVIRCIELVPRSSSRTITASLSASQAPSATSTGSVAPPSISPSPSLTPSQSVSAMPFSLLFSTGVRLSIPVTFVTSQTVSDSLPPTALRLWLNRCPSASDLIDLSKASISCDTRSDRAVYVALGTATSWDGTGAPGDTAPTAPVLLSSPCENADSLTPLAAVVWVGASFRPYSTESTISCYVKSQLGQALARATLSLSIIPTIWPLWDDAIIVNDAGLMRSARLGVVLNATASLTQ